MDTRCTVALRVLTSALQRGERREIMKVLDLNVCGRWPTRQEIKVHADNPRVQPGTSKVRVPIHRLS
jgi:hypothetical protein